LRLGVGCIHFARAIASVGLQERQAVMTDLERGSRDTPVLRRHIDSDREWRFDSLRDLLNQERPDGGDLTREYVEHPDRNESISRTLDR